MQSCKLRTLAMLSAKSVEIGSIIDEIGLIPIEQTTEIEQVKRVATSSTNFLEARKAKVPE